MAWVWSGSNCHLTAKAFCDLSCLLARRSTVFNVCLVCPLCAPIPMCMCSSESEACVNSCCFVFTSYAACVIWGGGTPDSWYTHIPMLTCHSCSVLHKGMNPSIRFHCWGTLYLHVLWFSFSWIISQLCWALQIVAVEKKWDVCIQKSPPCCFLLLVT